MVQVKVVYSLFIYSFICSSFYDSLLVTNNIQRQMKGWYVNDELERIWKEAVAA
jgi:hypothetical protein